MDEKASAALQLVTTARRAREDADLALADTMWAAHEAGVSKNELAREVSTTWSRMTVLDILAVAQWRAELRKVLTDAGLSVETFWANTKDSGLPTADVLLSVDYFRNRAATVVRKYEPIWTLHKIGFREYQAEDETTEEWKARGKEAIEQARTQWRAAVRERAQVTVRALVTAGYHLEAWGLDGRHALNAEEAVETLVNEGSMVGSIRVTEAPQAS
ncbi:hypothetical protein A5789_27775 [Nocardia sp. 852002-51101_SCH5132738]|uniref:hypothetical protein n=1 Tax=Nocardia sp. 852002-51101_SCH5132738 TaxID=1834095 RepID=UPI0007EA6214|nr:hypothetical protein [Nocardia sp. 852002-51101_SCH5132738]OBA51489.1 hypothetical protein A5789_27775 [Nocardia sp. 852002-51101_SCH5132738]